MTKSTIKIALISFLKFSINTRLLASYLKENGISVLSYYCIEKLDKLGLQKLISHLKEQNVTFVGVSLITDNYENAVTITKAIKSEINVQVIWGGAHPTIMPDECLKYADMVCRGEGEEALLEVLESFSMQGQVNTSIRNIWFNFKGKVIRNEIRNLVEDLDKYPFPDFDLSSQYILTNGGIDKFEEKHLLGEYGIMTSRGCPHSCAYCYNSYRRKHYEGKGRYLRVRSIENSIGELVMAKKIFKNLKRINFWDDSFVARHLEEFQIFETLYRERVNLPFFALIEPMAYDYNKIKLLRDAGLFFLQVGIQSGSDRINKEIYKRFVSKEKIYAMAKSIHALGIRAVYDVIFNNPYETKSDIRETIHMFSKFPRPLFLQGYNLIFYPGSDLTAKALRDGYISLNMKAEDFSLIQGEHNSPLNLRGKSEISGRFYTINYDPSNKSYLNSIIFILGLRNIPRKVALFFGNSESPFKTWLLNILIKRYPLAFR